MDFKFQYVDAAELARAFDQYRVALAAYTNYDGPVKGRPARPSPPADASGGFGYDRRAEPNPACPVCYGDGQLHTTLMDTTKLSAQALKLYKGIKVKGDGSIEVLMHDQMQARDMIIKMLGAYKEVGKGLHGAEPVAAVLAETASPEETQRAYLRMITGG